MEGYGWVNRRTVGPAKVTDILRPRRQRYFAGEVHYTSDRMAGHGGGGKREPPPERVYEKCWLSSFFLFIFFKIGSKGILDTFCRYKSISSSAESFFAGWLGMNFSLKPRPT